MASTVSRKRVRPARVSPAPRPERVGDMTREELRDLIKSSVEDSLVEILQDPDAGLELRPEIIAQIQQQRKQIAAGKPGKTLEELMQEYGIE
ncbi:MAG: hypothetical protein M1570_15755 [Chloroflexi bacterium]|nr:hypothetical protein [Chloroflexota bacterium]